MQEKFANFENFLHANILDFKSFPTSTNMLIHNGPISTNKGLFESWESPLSQHLRNFPVAKLPKPQIREIFLFYSNLFLSVRLFPFITGVFPVMSGKK